MAEPAPQPSHIHGDAHFRDKVLRDKIETQYNNFYGADPAAGRHLHLTYLRGLFGKPWADLPLADLAPGQGKVKLVDLYVPLPTDAHISYEVRDGVVQDWWVGRDDERLTQAESKGRDRMRTSGAHQLSEVQLQCIVDGLQRRLTAEREALPREREAQGQSPPEPDERSRIERYALTAEDLASLSDALVLVGDPGCGKSTTVRHFALSMAGDLRRAMGNTDVPAQATLRRLHHAACIAVTPIYIELRDLVAIPGLFPPLAEHPDKPALPGSDALWRYLTHHFTQTGDSDLLPFLDSLKKMLAEGEALVILDGLDEVDQATDPRRREQIQAFVRSLRERYQARVLVTSRPYAYNLKGEGESRPWRLDRFGAGHFVPLHEAHARRQAEVLFAQVDAQRGQALAQAFLAEVQGHASRVPAEFRTQPLFLTMLAGLWWQRRHTVGPDLPRLPQTEAELYRQSIEHLLTRWTKKDGVTDTLEDLLGLGVGQLRQVLQRVALETQDASQPGADTTELTGDAIALAVRGIRRGLVPDDVIDYFEGKAGVITSLGLDQYRFAHRSFQENLAAAELLKDPAQPQLSPLVERVFAQPALWRKVLEHAGDYLVTWKQVEALWALIQALIDPWLMDPVSIGHAQAALLALETAERNGLLSQARGRKVAHSQDLEVLTDIALALMTDARLNARDRAIAGRCLARLGDPRPAVMTVEAMEWCEVPAGPFQMGSLDSDELAYDDEKPLHEQHTSAFKLARFPVTNAQYRQFVQAGGYAKARYWAHAGERWTKADGYLDWSNKARTTPATNREPFGLDNHPVVSVTWYEAMAFARWLTEHLQALGKIGPDEVVRLPSEAEWEKTCRGVADARVTPWDVPPDPERGNYSASEIGETSTVGCFPSGRTPFGCEDMIGNVWEWTLTKWARDYEGYTSAENNEVDGSDDSRVWRGGSWGFVHGYARCASRDYSPPSVDDSVVLGFRVSVSAHLPPRA